MAALAERTVAAHSSPEQAVCRESQPYRQVAIQVEKIIWTLRQRGVRLSGGIKTGPKIRELKEMEVDISTAREGSTRRMIISLLAIPKERYNCWLGSVEVSVPTTHLLSIKDGFPERRNWFDTRAKILFRECGPDNQTEETELLPFGGHCPPEKFSHIWRVIGEAEDLIVSTNRSRVVTKNLAGKTTTIDCD